MIRKETVEQKTEKLLEAFLAERKFELVDVEYVKEGSDEPVWERYEKTINVNNNDKSGELKSFVEDILTPMDGAKKV